MGTGPAGIATVKRGRGPARHTINNPHFDHAHAVHEAGVILASNRRLAAAIPSSPDEILTDLVSDIWRSASPPRYYRRVALCRLRSRATVIGQTLRHTNYQPQVPDVIANGHPVELDQFRPALRIKRQFIPPRSSHPPLPPLGVANFLKLQTYCRLTTAETLIVLRRDRLLCARCGFARPPSASAISRGLARLSQQAGIRLPRGFGRVTRRRPIH